MADQLALDVDQFVVHCFFDHAHTVRAHDPDAAHDAMERHYAARHARQIEAVIAHG